MSDEIKPQEAPERALVGPDRGGDEKFYGPGLQKLIDDMPEDSGTIIRAGDVLTCPNGHPLAVARRDIDTGEGPVDLANFMESRPHEFRLPAKGDPIPTCPDCGERFCLIEPDRTQSVEAPGIRVSGHWYPAKRA